MTWQRCKGQRTGINSTPAWAFAAFPYFLDLICNAGACKAFITQTRGQADWILARNGTVRHGPQGQCEVYAIVTMKIICGVKHDAHAGEALPQRITHHHQISQGFAKQCILTDSDARHNVMKTKQFKRSHVLLSGVTRRSQFGGRGSSTLWSAAVGSI